MKNVIPIGKNMPIRTFYKPISKDLPQIPGLRFWYLSIKFGHEINLKDLIYLVLVD